MPSRPRICLNMIVKDEAHVIEACLSSVAPFIDYWVIVDTGSSDGTQRVIQAFFAARGLPGVLYERPWRDFGTNRTEALALARPHGDYALFIDADEALDAPPGFAWPEMTADSYLVDIDYGGLRYQREQLVRNGLPWVWRGVLHEYLSCPGVGTPGRLPLVIRPTHAGARARDPETYRKDAAVLERALAAETDPFLVSRYTFYLAQSFRDCGEMDKAVELYLRRADQGYWEQEVFVALLNAGRLMIDLGRPLEEPFAAFLRARAVAPDRAEALHGLACVCRLAGKPADALAYARDGLTLPEPDGLFVDGRVYDWGLLDELSLDAFWAGETQVALDACVSLLEGGKLPPEQRARVEENVRAARAKLGIR